MRFSNYGLELLETQVQVVVLDSVGTATVMQIWHNLDRGGASAGAASCRFRTPCWRPAFNGATLREVTIQVGHPEDFPSHQVHGPGSGGSGSGPGSGSAFVAPLVALWRAHEQSPDRGHPRGHGHRAYSDVRTTAWNLQVHALDLVGGKATTCACWNNTRHVILGVGGQENAFYVYDSAGSVVTLSCARENDSLLIQVPYTVADCTALHFLPGIGVLCHFPEGDKVVLFFEGRIPHCKSLSRMAWLQACGV